jgi:uncharacterized membrane protein YuzA (DUF378 family)
MIPVKIECACGQHYAFDVEPVDGRMGCVVACPICGADGTTHANEIIARSMPPPLLKPSGHFIAATELSAPTASKVSANARQMGLVDRQQAEVEARAKISWGDPQEAVIKYLMMQGFNLTEAAQLAQALFKERLATVRANGVRKIFTGIGLMFVPVVAFCIFACFGVMPLFLMAIPVMIGLCGVWRLLNGILMLAAPKMESGDVAS